MSTRDGRRFVGAGVSSTFGAVGVVVAVLVAVVLFGGCGLGRSESRPSREAAATRLTQMIEDTVGAVGLGSLETVEERGYSGCTAPLILGTEVETWSLRFPGVELQEARSILRELNTYWSAEAPSWSSEDVEVKDDSIDTKETPAVFLRIDGYSLGATFFPGRDVADFGLSGSTPCVDTADD